MIICYLTNPIVVLFCNEEGELPGFLNLWQTWDDSCNPEFFVLEKVPKFLRYDYKKHYEEYESTTPKLAKYGRTRWFARVIDGNFTLKERIQRYICRVLWLTRNCAYGFAFYWFSKEANKETSVTYKKYIHGEKYFIAGWDKSQPLWKRTWWIKCNWHWNKRFYSECYLGWKINSNFPTDKQYSMIANRLIPINIESNLY